MGQDFNNIVFILNKTPEELRVWWELLTEDEKQYAMEILIDYRKMLDEPVVEEYVLAKEYLKKFQL
jgi:hypothetical protein